MEQGIGAIVKSRAGRDKDYFFAIIKLEGKTALVADGKLHKIEKPKKKKLSHLSRTNETLSPTAFECNKRLYKAIGEKVQNKE